MIKNNNKMQNRTSLVHAKAALMLNSEGPSNYCETYVSKIITINDFNSTRDNLAKFDEHFTR